MTAKDQLKVLRAGFTIIREDIQNLKIKHKIKDLTNWTTYESGFKSKAELRRRMDELLKLTKIIED
jgi:hypothetical protein